MAQRLSFQKSSFLMEVTFREKIKLNFYFHISLWCLKSFYEGFLVQCPNLENFNDTIPRKRPDRWKVRWKDGQKDRREDRQTQFHKTLPATVGGPKILRKDKY